MAATPPKAVGIDFGTTYTVVALFDGKHATVIPNKYGDHTTPSVVRIACDETRVVGKSAQREKYPKTTIHGVKRFIGRKFCARSVQYDIKQFQYEVTNRHDGPVIEVDINGKSVIYTPQDIASFILKDVLSDVEAYLDCKVTQAVITVPAHFDNSQRTATQEAAQLAGLGVLRIINEPTAAVLGYSTDCKASEGPRNVLVYDLGGGTYDVSLAVVAQGVVEIKATGGDPHLGGEDFNNCLMRHCENEFKKEHGKTELQLTERPKSRLRHACETAKRQLFVSNEINVYVEALHEGLDLDVNITAAKFEEICDTELGKIDKILLRVVEDAKMTAKEIHEVILVGGSTRLPFVERRLKALGYQNIIKAINADEAVAIGAAVQAFQLTNEEDPGVQLLDVCPMSLGIGLSNGMVRRVVHRNTPIPLKKSEMFQTTFDDQKALDFAIYEGEYWKASQDNLLDMFTLDDISPAPAGKRKFKVTIEIDENGITTVTAEDVESGNKKDIKIDRQDHGSRGTKRRASVISSE